MRSWTFAAKLLLVSLFIGTSTPAFAVNWAKHYQSRVSQFKKHNRQIKGQSRKVVLVGDSLTEGWKYKSRVKKFLAPIADRVVNRGISSDGVGVVRRGVLRRMDSTVEDIDSSHIVLMIGINDIGPTTAGLKRLKRKYAELVDKIQSAKPESQLILVTVTPVGPRLKKRMPQIKAMNEFIQGLATENGLELIDLHKKLAGPDGLLPVSMARDHLHFQDRGYEIFGEEILKVVDRPLPESTEIGLPLPEETAEQDSEASKNEKKQENPSEEKPSDKKLSDGTNSATQVSAPEPRAEPAKKPKTLTAIRPDIGATVETTFPWLNVRKSPISGKVQGVVRRATPFVVKGISKEGWIEVLYKGRKAYISPRAIRVKKSTVGLSGALQGLGS